MHICPNDYDLIVKAIKEVIQEVSKQNDNTLQYITLAAGILGPIITGLIILLFTKHLEKNDEIEKAQLNSKIEELKSDLSLTNSKIIEEQKYQYDKSINELRMNNEKFVVDINNIFENKRAEADVLTQFRLKSYSMTLDVLFSLNSTIQELIWMTREITKIGDENEEKNISEKIRKYQIQIHNAYFYLDGELISCALHIWGATLNILHGRIHSPEWESDYQKNIDNLEEFSNKYGKLLKSKYYFDNAEINVQKIAEKINEKEA